MKRGRRGSAHSSKQHATKARVIQVGLLIKVLLVHKGVILQELVPHRKKVIGVLCAIEFGLHGISLHFCLVAHKVV